MAVKIVSEKSIYKNIAGIDNDLWIYSDSKIMAAIYLKKNLKRLGLRKVLIRKGEFMDKVFLSTINDRAHQFLFTMRFSPVLYTSENFSYSFRGFRSLEDFYGTFKTFLSKKMLSYYAFELYLFPRFVSRQKKWLLKSLHFENSFLRFIVYRDSKYFFTSASCFSLLLLLIKFFYGFSIRFLDLNFIKRMNKSFLKKLQEFKLISFSFRNSFLFLNFSLFYLNYVKISLRNLFKIRGLSLLDFKSNFSNLNEKFNFLSWQFNYINSSLYLGFLNEKVVKFHKYNLNLYLKKFFYYSPSLFVVSINKLIKNWVKMYYYSDCFSFLASYFDYYLSKNIWKFLVYFHSNRSKLWIFNNYWVNKNQVWCFFVLDPFLKKSFYLSKHFFITKIRYSFNLSFFFNDLNLFSRLRIKKFYLIKLRFENKSFYFSNYKIAK